MSIAIFLVLGRESSSNKETHDGFCLFEVYPKWVSAMDVKLASGNYNLLISLPLPLWFIEFNPTQFLVNGWKKIGYIRGSILIRILKV